MEMRSVVVHWFWKKDPADILPLGVICKGDFLAENRSTGKFSKSESPVEASSTVLLLYKYS